MDLAVVEDNVNELIERLRNAEKGLAHLAMVADVQYGSTIAVARTALINASKVIEEQDTTIRALMGEYGDACDVAGCGNG